MQANGVDMFLDSLSSGKETGIERIAEFTQLVSGGAGIWTQKV